MILFSTGCSRTCAPPRSLLRLLWEQLRWSTWKREDGGPQIHVSPFCVTAERKCTLVVRTFTRNKREQFCRTRKIEQLQQSRRQPSPQAQANRTLRIQLLSRYYVVDTFTRRSPIGTLPLSLRCCAFASPRRRLGRACSQTLSAVGPVVRLR